MSLDLFIAYVLALGVSLAAVLISFRLSRVHRYRFLIQYRNYLVFLATYCFLQFAGGILIPQIFTEDDGTAFLAGEILALIDGPAFSIAVYLMFHWALALLGQKMPRWLSVGYWTLQVLVYMTVFSGFSRFLESRDYDAFARLSMSVSLVAIAMVLVPPLVLLLGSGRITNPSRRKLARGLGAIHAGIVALVLMLQLAAIPPPSTALGYGILFSVFFALQIAPLLYMRPLLARAHLEPEMPMAFTKGIDRLAADIGVTTREGEVIQLLIQGLTNNEIAAKLFISPQTVKNNISSIFRKAGVRNRVELVNLVRGENGAP